MRIWILALCVALSVAPPCAAQSRDTAETTLRRHTACFATALGITPRWELQVNVAQDSSGRAWFGRTDVGAIALEAHITYNLHAIAQHAENLRLLALHEVLHVALGEMLYLAHTASPELAKLENERLVRQMVRWPNWTGVCR